MSKMRLTLLVVFIGFSSACSQDLDRPVTEFRIDTLGSDPVTEFRVDTLGSVPIAKFRIDTLGSVPVTRNLATEPVPAPEVFRPREVFRIGSAAGAEEILFGGPLINVSNGPNDQLFVLDQAAGAVRVFGADGTFLRQFGRPGRGPGEFESPSALAWSSDGLLWIPEPFALRYSIFDSLGTFVTTHPRPFFGGVSRRVYPAVFGPDSVLLDHASSGGGAAVFSISASGVLLDSFPPMLSPPDPSPRTIVAGRDREWVTAARNFRPRLVWTLAPDGTLWMARSDSLRLIHRTLEGDTLRIIEVSHRAAEFTPSERAMVARVAGMYEQFEFTPIVVESLHASDDGLLFVQIPGEGGSPGQDIDVFGVEGEYVGTFKLDIPLQRLAQSDFSGGYFTYVGVGELDVPIVVRTRLSGRPLRPR